MNCFFRLAIVVASMLSVAPVAARDGLSTNWRNVATKPDRERLHMLRQAWADALAKARGAGESKAIAAQGALFDPDRALTGAKPPAGSYRCRVYKLGAKRPGNRDFAVYPAFQCRIGAEGALQRFSKLDGSQRPTGLLFDDGDYRQIFLGTLVLGDEARPVDYGRDAGRDMAGAVERVGPQRWRLVLPYPQFESVLDVIELTPAP